MAVLPLDFIDLMDRLERAGIASSAAGLGLPAVLPTEAGIPKTLLQMLHLPSYKAESRCPVAYSRPWSELLRKGEGGASTVKDDKDKFRVDLDVQHFGPDEINVKVADHCVTVEGRHEEKADDHGWVARQFSRRYIVPEQCDIEQVSAKLSSDGVLSIIVPRKEKPLPNGERVINIEHTGKPSIHDSPSAANGSAEQKME
ncbi:protein lethal(2)essential for life-like [Hylaeus anthracinus]|uniref:protein lethal(2)essential for life-like n=1 Tax=Hylaeus anthracinus TaxID=313031 RepID=UPI0023B94BBE|nr:protein lethal(2)essential for life-like [Hylaeus anthracinus]